MYVIWRYKPCAEQEEEEEEEEESLFKNEEDFERRRRRSSVRLKVLGLLKSHSAGGPGI